MDNVNKAEWLASQPWIDRDDANMEPYLQKYAGACDFDLKEKLAAWKRDGIVIFEQVVDTRLIDALLGDIDYLRRHHMDFDLLAELKGHQGHINDFLPADLESDGVKFNSIHTISRAAARLSLTREVAQFLGVVFDDAPCATQSLTFYKGSQQPIHIDYPYVRTQTRLAYLAASWIPLQDIHPDSGPLAYYPGSHNVDVSDFFDWGQGSILLEPDSDKTPAQFAEYLYARMREKNVAPKVFCPRKGDVLIWHGNLAHEGTAIRDAALTRKSYVTHYTSLAAYPPAHLKPGAPHTGVIASENGGYVFEHSWQGDLRQLPSSSMQA